MTVLDHMYAAGIRQAKINQKEYKSIVEYVRDWALISYNAQVYNLPNSGAYQDALTIKAVVQRELGKFVEDNVLTAQEAEFPFLGEIPAQEDYPIEEIDLDEMEGDGSDAEEEDDDEDPLLKLPGFRVGRAGIEKVHDLSLRGTGGSSVSSRAAS